MRLKISCYEQDHVHNPPYPQSPEGQKLAYCRTSVAKTKTVHSKKAEKNWIQESRNKAVTGISAKKKGREKSEYHTRELLGKKRWRSIDSRVNY